jgi:hypothetical protein
VNLPSLKFEFVGDKVESHVIRRRIVTLNEQGEYLKALVLDLRLNEPRIQDDLSFIDCSWWLRPGTYAVAELGRVLKAANALYGAPLPGDWLSIELGGTRPPSGANKAPKKLYVIEYRARDVEEEQPTTQEPF